MRILGAERGNYKSCPGWAYCAKVSGRLIWNLAPNLEMPDGWSVCACAGSGSSKGMGLAVIHFNGLRDQLLEFSLDIGIADMLILKHTIGINGKRGGMAFTLKRVAMGPVK